MSAAPNLPLFRKPGELKQFPPPRKRWTRVAGWILAATLIIIMLLVIAAAVLLHNQSFHRYVLRVAQQKASAALNTQVEVRDFALHLSSLSLDLYGVVVHGAMPHPNPPLLEAERAGSSVVLSWPATATGFGLETSYSLTSTNWVAATNSATRKQTATVTSNSATMDRTPIDLTTPVAAIKDATTGGMATTPRAKAIAKTSMRTGVFFTSRTTIAASRGTTIGAMDITI